MVNALKEPAKSKAMTRSEFAYSVSKWSGGEQGQKTLVDTLAAAGK